MLYMYFEGSTFNLHTSSSCAYRTALPITPHHPQFKNRSKIPRASLNARSSGAINLTGKRRNAQKRDPVRFHGARATFILH